ncbi:MAG: hypothetical protein A3I89_01160 [Candidatus Harrisonbacteria bacterium RIFCSPLOWO2_02_FULL_41_11]|uniref:Glycosyltransferase RgtA/B/C/D-like domain-containing protein n=1 Tax=Candidatus Harrisonbacteria bacterium RIFCSPHIGHO2_02_FULL_42_16 TaxID=1798404 RepID=A0A1G1ZIC0_9BACT|nr:MAG: hypothetical protein A3B92_00650 [Candidatus Harrisonbacteria bacterium RIFCSPHIGHO2_02_FULL_42_16]OGY67580.1 MAG: hypothetical protein A3I89_01160 [Candidatus Harrisonbacteria bacterium RIFCSPLOWO2_02_FULL_41_11]
MSKILNSRNLLLVIIVLAFIFRIWGIGDRDLFGDEGVDAFRGVGYVDYLGTSFQTQPIDWFRDTTLPWWTNLSFHDFPPLAMIIQRAFFAVFGDSILVARLPAVIFGTLSVLLIYFIVRRFLREGIALLATFLFGINSVMVWIFRTSILEPILLFFILLNIYYFFKFIESMSGFRESIGFPKSIYWALFGVTFGFVALTKYTGVFLLPVYFVYLLIYDRKIFKSWQLYAALLIVFLLFTPVLIYNFYLYQATGHFDLQFAYLLGQETPEWTGLVGKVQAPFSEIWKNLATGAYESPSIFSSVVSYQIPFLVSAVMGFLYFLYRFVKKAGSQEERKLTIFLGLYLIFVTLLLAKIGSAHRFLALYGPIFVILSSVALNWLWAKSSALKFLVGVFLVWEIFYSINRNLIQVPDYGIAKLDHFLEEEFKGKESGVIPESDNPHLNVIIKKFVNNKKGVLRQAQDKRVLAMIVYNDNVELPILDWVFYRRFFYHSTPVLFVENFNKAISAQGENYFKNFTIYFVQSTENTLLNQFKKEKIAGLEFENRLQEKGLRPVKIIYGHNNLPMFRVYKFII